MAPRSGYAWMQLARGLATCPALHEAVATGMVSPRKALLLFALPEPDTWTAAAISMSCVELKRCVRAGGFEGATTEYEIDSVVLCMTAEQQDRLDAALVLARQVVGPAAPRWQLMEAIAMEYLGEHGGASEENGNSMQTRVEPYVSESSGESFAAELPADPEELDRRIRSILRERTVRDAEFGRYLLGVQRSREYKAHGFDSFESYVQDRLGISPRTARLRVWLEKRMEVMPELREALTDGRLTFEKARLIAKSANPFSVDGLIEDATSTTCQQVERDTTAEEDRQNRARGVRLIWGPADAFAVLMDAIALAGDSLSPGEGLARVADHFVEVWTANLEKPSGTKARRKVLGRHRGLCGVPGCSAEAQHEHHIDYRSHGGGNELENRVGLCAAHHLHGVHAGYLKVQGRAGEELVWRFGDETWSTSGDDDVRRETSLERTT